MGLAIVTLITQYQLLMDLERVGIEVVTNEQWAFMANLIVQPILIKRIKATQKEDLGMVRLVAEVKK